MEMVPHLIPQGMSRSPLFWELEASIPLVWKESESGWMFPLYNTKKFLVVNLAQCSARTAGVCLLTLNEHSESPLSNRPSGFVSN